MKKRIISIILLLAMAASLSTVAFADGFPDLENHWAKPFIESLVERGLMSGYPDGTMRPDNQITAVETLALLSRFYSPSDEVMEKIRGDYLDTVKDALPGTEWEWAHDSVCICLAAGVLSVSQLKALEYDKALEKQILSAFLVRTMQEETKASGMADTTLPFNDVNDISKDYIGHIAVLYEARIVVGDDKNNYGPKGGVNRAIVGTMVVKTMEYLENQGVELTIPGYEEEVPPTPPVKPGTQYTGVITMADTGYVVLRDYKGVARRFSLSEVTVNGSPALMTSSLIGCYGTLIKPENSASCSINVEQNGSTVYVQGSLASTGTSGGSIVTERYVNVTNTENGRTNKYTLDNNTTKYIVGGNTASFSALSKGQFVTLKIVSGIPSEVYAESGSYELTGAVSVLDFSTNIFEINTEDNNTIRFVLNPDKLPAVTRGPHNVSINLLTIGSPVNLNVRDGILTTIALAGEFRTITGMLTDRHESLSGTTWVITDSYGAKHTLALDGSAPVYNGTQQIDMSEIKIGDNLSVDAYAGTVVEIRLEHTGETRLTGVIRTVNAADRSLTMLVDNKIIEVDCSAVTNIIDLATNKSLSLALLSPGNNITVSGKYASAGSSTFKASDNILVNP